MDNCIDCKIERIKKYLLCVDCDDKLNVRIKKQIRDNWNWPFNSNENISKQQIRNHNKIF